MLNTVKNYTFGQGTMEKFACIITVDTRNVTAVGNATNQFTLPLAINTSDFNINFVVDWGDGVVNTVRSKSDANRTHTYSIGGIYVIKTYPKNQSYKIIFNFENNGTERLKIIKLTQWGNFAFDVRAFHDCVNMDLSEVTDVPYIKGSGAIGSIWNNIFWGCKFSSINRLSEWVFMQIDIINYISYNNTNFNQDFTLNAPDATTLSGICFGATSFNSNIVINAPNAVNVNSFFRGATVFNKDVSTWFNWSNITSMTDFMRGKTSANYNPLYYDNLLIALDNGGQINVPLGMGTIKYTSAGATAKANLVAKGWTITDGGMI